MRCKPFNTPSRTVTLPSGLAALLCGMAVLCAPTKAFAQPRLLLEKGYGDAGYHSKQSSFPFEFPVANGGDQPLKLKMEGSCSCLFLDESEAELAPGERVIIKGHIETQDQRGEQRRAIVLHSNDPGKGKTEIQIEYRVNVEVEVSSGYIWLGAIKPGQVFEKELNVESRLGLTGKIVRVVAESERVQAEIKEPAVTPDAPGRIAVRYEAPKEPGLDSTVLFVYADLGSGKALPVMFEALVSNLLSGDLADLDFGPIKAGEAARKTTALQWLGPSPPAVLKVEVSDVTGQLKPSANKNSYELQLEWRAKEPYGPAKGAIKLRFNEGGDQRIVIPVRAFIEP